MWRCPKCHLAIRIFNVTTTVISYPNGADVDGDLEWGDENQAECVSCGWAGTAGEAWDANTSNLLGTEA